MIRSAAVVAAALRLAAPGLPDAQVAAYVPIVRQEARVRHFDPVTLVALVDHESGWRAGTVGGLDGQCIGLGQVCLHFQPACRDRDWTSPACLARKSYLLHGPANLREVARLITAHREFCRRKTGRRALFARWLSSYGGWNNSKGRRGVWCNMKRDRRGRWRDVRAPAGVRAIMADRRRLLRVVVGSGP